MSTATTAKSVCGSCGAQVLPAMVRCRECGRRRDEKSDAANEVEIHEASALLEALTSGQANSREAGATSSESTTATVEFTESAANELASQSVTDNRSLANRIAVKCGCGARLNVPFKFAGRRIKCRKCDQRIEVPNSKQPSANSQPPDAAENAASAENADLLLAEEIQKAIQKLDAAVSEPAPSTRIRPWTFRRISKLLLDKDAYLATEDIARVCNALTELGESCDSRAVELIKNWTESDSADIRQATARALGHVASKEALLALFEMIKTDSLSLRRAVIEAIGECDSPHAVRVLLAISLVEPQLKVVVNAALQAMAETASPVLCELVCQGTPPFAAQAVPALASIGGKSAVRSMVSMHKYDCIDLRAAIATGLADEDLQIANSALNCLLQDPEQVVREKAAATLVKTPHARSARFLIGAMADRSPIVRRHAAVALGKLGDMRAVEMLIKQLDDTDPNVVIASVEALGEIGDSVAASPILDRIKFAKPDLQLKMISAIRGMACDRIVPELTELLDCEEKQLRRRVTDALGYAQSEKELAGETLRTLLTSDANHEVRAAAAKSLGQLKLAGSEDVLEAGLRDEFNVRCAAIVAIGMIAHESSLPALVAMLRDQAYQVRYQAAVALGKLQSTRATRPLTNLLADAEKIVRRAAERSIAQIEAACGIEPVNRTKKLIQRTAQKWNLQDLAARLLPTSRTGLSVAATSLVLFIAVVGYFNSSIGGQPLELKLPVQSAIIVGDGSHAILNRQGGRLELWNLDSNQIEKSVHLNVGGFMVKAGGPHSVAAVQFKSLVFCDVSSEAEPLTEPPEEHHRAPIANLIINPTQSHALTHGLDGEVILWDLLGNKKLSTTPQKFNGAMKLALNSKADLIAAGDATGVLVVHEFKTGELIGRWKLPSRVAALGFVKGSDRLIAADSVGIVSSLDIERKQLKTLHKPKSQVSITAQQSAPDGSHIAFGTASGRVILFDVENSSVRVVEIAGAGRISALSHSHNGNQLIVSTGEAATAWLIDTKQARLTKTIQYAPE